MSTTDQSSRGMPAWLGPILRRVVDEVSPRRVRTPGAGDSHVGLWSADRVWRSVRSFVVLTTGSLLVVLMVAAFDYAPAPGHQLAAVMLWVTGLGVAAAIVGPRLAVRSYESGLYDELREFRRAGDAELEDEEAEEA